MTSGHIPVPSDARRVQGHGVPALGTSIIRSQQLPELPHAHIHDPRAGLLQGIASQPASQPWRAKFTPCTALLCTGSAGSHEGRQRTALARSQFDVTLLRLHPRLPECPRSEIYGRATLLPGGCLLAERRHEKRGQLQKHPLPRASGVYKSCCRVWQACGSPWGEPTGLPGGDYTALPPPGRFVPRGRR